MTPVANARMYSATASVRANWKQLLAWALARAGLAWDVIDYDAPAPLSALWARDDLGLAMMCGLPFSQRAPRPTLVAAPLPSPARYGGRPVYFTDIVVRTGSAFETLADTFGGIVGYTLADSMSGGVALRNHLAPYRAARGTRLYRGAVGGLIHARGVIEALVEGRIDVGPLDSYYHDLLRRNEPALAQKVRIVDSTEAMPIPPLVATAPLTPGELARIRSALQEATRAPELAAVTERLLLAGFVSPDPADYDVLAAISLRSIPPFEEL
ncbi:phosphate/phosphite/phosphonate ABC transporter substrate-binding protein [Variovorax paradoxus]|uniref:phosphate/phosphite/phosphonate ABC transporter substrate-binding protein n=1 Tax=Variovorax paradoxus TaxID=34073 RepID=UPI002785D869|nr:PhnD/SsuA/transferrin family substrate-binding protein [Variovorax paradoxus]MDQ0588607.1 ABC-type phosphate/phosphonate transport system substrate-binding protein [Variovorax paradoxus]